MCQKTNGEDCGFDYGKDLGNCIARKRPQKIGNQEATFVHKLVLTFDIEDFIDPNEISALKMILELLDKHELRALFFITGHMAEKLAAFRVVADVRVVKYFPMT